MGQAASQSRGEIVQTLQEQVRKLEGARRPQVAPISCGIGPLDRLLPAGGFQPGTLVEWLAGSAGSGASTLALLAAREACRSGKSLVVVDPQRRFYPPAAAAWGVDLSNSIVICPDNDKDHHWAVDQSLACPGVGAVLCWPERLDGKTFRRLQLAAESGGSLGLLVRPSRARGQPSWAEIRLLVEPRVADTGRRLRVELLRCRGAAGGRAVELNISDGTGKIHEANSLHLASELAHPAAPRRSSGA